MVSMKQSTSLWSSLLLTALFWALAIAKPSISMDYCSGLNTATMPANHSIYQSDGLCFGFCKANFALAIVKGDSCWCSNFVPDRSVQVSTSQCNDPCPGFPADVCGGNGVYGYMRLSKEPSGTVGAVETSQTSSPADPKPPTSTPVKVTTQLLTSTVQQTVQKTIKSTINNIQTSSDTSGTPEPSQSPTEQQKTTVTVGGTVKTIIISASSAPQGSSSSSTAGATEDPKHGLSAGAAAGVAVGVVVSLLVIGGAIAWFMIKRRRQAAEELAAGTSSPSNRGSSAGMMASPRDTEVSETRYYNSPPGGPVRRQSTLMPVDPRLDPYLKPNIYNRTENKSHESVNTIEDNHDYSRRIQEPSRVLRAVNPDPELD